MKKTSSVYIPHYGCPNDCIFCNQVKISGKTTQLDYELMKNDILRDVSTMKKEDILEIAFFGGSFTAIEPEVQENCLKIADALRSQLNREIKIKLSTRPDAIDEQVISRLVKYKVDCVELGMQSLDNEVLKITNRGHSSKCVFEASKMIKKANIQLGLQIMIGLPKDTKDKMKDTIEKVISIKPDIARIYPVLVIRDTALEKMYIDGIYKPISVEQAVQDAKYMYKKLEKNDIKVIRIGLQATENINFFKDVVAGPFHSAFGELVLNEIYKDEIENIVIEKSLKNQELQVQSNPKYISKIIGNKKSNFNYFKEKYNISLKIKHILEDDVRVCGVSIYL